MLGGNLMPVTGVLGLWLGLGDQLKTPRDLEGSPGLVAPVGTGDADVARLAAVRAQTSVKPTLALCRGKRAPRPACSVDVHSSGAVAEWLVVLQALLVGWGGRLGNERLAGGGWRVADPSGGVGVGLVGLHEERCCDVPLQGKGERTVLN